MRTSIESPYPRFLLIARLAELCQQRGRSLGRTALQKYVYLLQALYQLDLGYEFQLYTYGPFCSELLSDLDFAETAQIINVAHATSGYGGYEIRPSAKFDEGKNKSGSFLETHDTKITELFSKFGDFTAKELELRATIVFCDRDNISSRRQSSRSDFISAVHEIKPGFTNREIEVATDALEQDNFIQRRQ
jgi:uncharacterized protein